MGLPLKGREPIDFRAHKPPLFGDNSMKKSYFLF